MLHAGHCPTCGGWNRNPWWTAAYPRHGRWLVRPARHSQARDGTRPTVRIRRRQRLCSDLWHGDT